MKFDCNMYIHPTQARGLTPREAARVQSYPDDYFFQRCIYEDLYADRKFCSSTSGKSDSTCDKRTYGKKVIEWLIWELKLKQY